MEARIAIAPPWRGGEGVNIRLLSVKLFATQGKDITFGMASGSAKTGDGNDSEAGDSATVPRKESRWDYKNRTFLP